MNAVALSRPFAELSDEELAQEADYLHYEREAKSPQSHPVIDEDLALVRAEMAYRRELRR